MTSKIKIQKNSRENNVSEDIKENSIRALLSKRITKKVPFMGTKIDIQKLTVAEVMEIQEQAKSVSADETDESGFASLRNVIRLGNLDAAELTDEEFDMMPLGEIVNLSNEIMKFSGIDPNERK